MKEKDSITLSLKKEEEIKTIYDSFSDNFQNTHNSEVNSFYQINNSELESLVSKYTDLDNNDELLKYIDENGVKDTNIAVELCAMPDKIPFYEKFGFHSNEAQRLRIMYHVN